MKVGFGFFAVRNNGWCHLAALTSCTASCSLPPGAEAISVHVAQNFSARTFQALAVFMRRATSAPAPAPRAVSSASLLPPPVAQDRRNSLPPQILSTGIEL